MSDEKRIHRTTMLRENEKLQNFRSHTNSNLQCVKEKSGFLYAILNEEQYTAEDNSMPKPTSKSTQTKNFENRGIAMEELARSMLMTSNQRLTNSYMNYSNSSIEQYYNKCRKEKSKILMEKNEKKWGKLFNAKKKDDN